MPPAHILILSCADRPGIVARVTGELYGHGANILAANHFEDFETGHIFVRVAFTLPEPAVPSLHRALDVLAGELAMSWRLRRTDARPKVVLLVSKFDHCLVDLLYRQRIGEFAMDIVAIVANHPRETYGDLGAIPFHYLPVSPDTRPAQEARIRAIVEETAADLIVLARYMQILSDDMAAFLAGRCINIHHSFLPGFKGAKPYHQAHARGVKMIGATAHYVTAELDEGPIIAQDVEPVSHADSPDDLIRKGRDIERRVLARAVSAHLEMRALLNGAKTIVFSS